MSIENILAVRMGEYDVWASGAVDTGLRAIIAVHFIDAEIQTYTVFGQSLYMIWYDVGQLTTYQAFSFFCKEFYNKEKGWYQLSAPPPNPLLQGSQIYLTPAPPPPPPIAHGQMTLLDSGYSPLKGFWLKFAGNFDHTCPLFHGFTGVNRLIPNYQIRQT